MAQAELTIVTRLKDEASRGLGSVGSAVGNLAKLAAGAAVAGTAAMGAFGVAAIRMGSDAEEMMGKFNVVFGDVAREVERDLDAMAAAIGRNKYDMRGWAATLQDTFVPLGFARDEAAEMSKTLAGLTVDVASFNNASEPEVLAAFQSALVGNHETMRQYGVIITQATLDQELLNMGIEGGVKSATEQEKVMARMNIIMAGTADAHGDAARTADSWANQMRALRATLAETTTEIGEGLLPIVTPLLARFGEFAQDIAPRVIEAFGGLVERVVGLKDNFEPFALAFSNFRFLVDNGIEPLEAFKIMLGTLVPENVMGMITPLVDAVGTLATKAGEAKLAWEGFQFLVGEGMEPMEAARIMLSTFIPQETVDRILGAAQALGDFVGAVVSFVENNPEAVRGALVGLGAAFATMAIAGAVASAVASLTAAIALMVSPLGLVAIAVGLLAAAWNTDFMNIATNSKATWNEQIKPTLDRMVTHIGVMNEQTSKEWGLFVIAWNKNWEQLVKDVKTFIGNLDKQWEQLKSDIRAVGDWIKNVDWYDIGKSLMQGLINGVKAMFPSLASAGETAVNTILGAARRFGLIESPSKLMRDKVGKPMGEGIIQGLQQALAGNSAVDAIRKYFDAILEDGDYLNDWLTHIPEHARGSLRQIGQTLAGVDGDRNSPMNNLFEHIADTIGNAIGGYRAGDPIERALGSVYDRMMQMETMQRVGGGSAIGGMFAGATINIYANDYAGGRAAGEGFADALRSRGLA